MWRWQVLFIPIPVVSKNTCENYAHGPWRMKTNGIFMPTTVGCTVVWHTT